MSSRGAWVRITGCANIPLREGRAVRLGEREIAIFNLGDRFLAIENRCPHQGGPLADGIVCGTSVVCPLHAWKIDLEDGTVQRPVDNRACVETFPTKLENGTILLKHPECTALQPSESETVSVCTNSRSRLEEPAPCAASSEREILPLQV